MTNLPYGLNPLPDGVETAWGARWIVKADGMVDPVFDRMAAVGDLDKRRALLDHLNDHAGTKPQERARDLLRGYPDTGHLDEPRLSTRSESVVTLWEDEEVIVQASPNASGGYLYVRAYYKADVHQPEPVAVPPGPYMIVRPHKFRRDSTVPNYVPVEAGYGEEHPDPAALRAAWAAELAEHGSDADWRILAVTDSFDFVQHEEGAHFYQPPTWRLTTPEEQAALLAPAKVAS